MECVNEAKIDCRALFGIDVLSLRKCLFQFLSWMVWKQLLALLYCGFYQQVFCLKIRVKLC